MNHLNNSYNYNDLASLNAITRLGNDDQAQALKQVARQFESMFVSMMLKTMRDANAVFEKDNPLNSNESKFYRQMFDDQLALSLSKYKGIGLADTIYRQLNEQFVKDKTKTSGQILPLEAAQNQTNPFSSLKPNYQFNDAPQPEPNHQPQATVKQTEQEKTHEPMADDSRPVQSAVSQPTDHRADKAAASPINKQAGFSSPQEFVTTLWPTAQQVAKELGVDARAIVAQAALETGWGKHIIHQGSGNNSHNLFGIKADSRWSGQVARVSTLEYREGIAQKEVAPFRVYESYEASLKDYGQFILSSDRYQGALKQAKTISGYSEGLQQGGYATDPNYAKKIQRIAAGSVLNEALKKVTQHTGQG